MDKLLRNIGQYRKIVIVGDDISEDLSNMVYKSIVKKFEDIREFYKKARMLTNSPKYKYFDMFFEDNHKGKYRKFGKDDFGNYILRVKGNGYNIHNLGLQNSHPVFHKSELIITVKGDICKILNDDIHTKNRKRECDINVYYRSYKISKISFRCFFLEHESG